eukprot:TRINITY_DN3075_c0_g1_i2.p1 TRINITY_DN3075_c0_g1~~TRINITY_DN3075_c0_g1_i2.p1  ORF type:complete len:445 (+),score=52.20 TRINITY_DN3075_c0_g1_i2:34-1335(+)
MEHKKLLSDNSVHSEEPQPTTTRAQILTVCLLMLSFAFVRTAIFVQLFATPLAATSMLINESGISGISTIPLSFIYYGGCFIAPFASKFMQAVGRLKGFILGCFLGMLGAAICVVATWFHSTGAPAWGCLVILSIGSLLLGFANGIVNFFRFAAADAVPHKRSFAISAVLFGGDVAALSGPPLGLWTKTLIWEFGASYIAIIILFFCAFLVLLLVNIPELTKPDLTGAVPPRSIWGLLKVPRLTLALVTGTIGFGCMVLLMGLIPVVMRSLSFEEAEISHVLQVHGVGMFLPSLVLGFVIERFGTMVTIFTGLLLLLGANGFMITGTGYWQFMVGMLFCGFGWNLSFIGSTTMLIECYLPAEKATTQGANDFVMYLIVSSLTLASGSIWEALGSWQNVNYFSMALTLLGVVSMIFVFVGERVGNNSSKTQSIN